jgi:uncharacterized repeat protein (TIGR04076 family)
LKSVARITRDVVAVVREIKGSCAAGIKVGDVLYFSGANLVKEKSDEICAYALTNIMPVVFSCRLGVDFDKLGIGGRLWQCVDPGPPYTPGGTVFFEIMPAEEFEKEKLKENC